MGLRGKEAAKVHLTLAEGLINTAELSSAPSEYEIRNAFSRSYYALFHASRGYLWARGVDVDALGKKHGRLHDEMGKWMGRSFGDFLRTSYELRRMSDYTPEWPLPPTYWTIEKLKAVRRQLYFLIFTARRELSFD